MLLLHGFIYKMEVYMKIFNNQPAAFYTLLLTEAWERFNYYGILSILVIYLTKNFFLKDTKAYLIYGIYTTLSFALPLLGGYIGDKFKNKYRCITLGLFLTIVSDFILTIANLNIQYYGLAILIVAIALFKANNISIFSEVLKDFEEKKESAFTFFYMSMNLGAILGPIVFGYIILFFSIRDCFIVSGIGSALVLLIVIKNRLSLKLIRENTKIKKYSFLILLVLSVILILFISILFKFNTFFYFLIATILIAMGLHLATIIFSSSKMVRNNILLLIILNCFSILYFASSFQTSSSLLLYINRSLNLNFFGFHIPAPVFASLNPLFVILSTPILAILWNKVGKVVRKDVVIYRVLVGLILAGLSFVIFMFSTRFSYQQSLFSILFILVGNLTLGMGEACIGPAIISAISYFAPKEKQGTFMGFWYLSIAFSAYISSIFAKLSDNKKVTYNNSYHHAFLVIAIIVLFSAVVLFLIKNILKKLSAQT